MQESSGSIRLHDSVLQHLRLFYFLLRCKASFGASFCANTWSFMDLNLEFYVPFLFLLVCWGPFSCLLHFLPALNSSHDSCSCAKCLFAKNLLVRSCQMHFFTLARVTSIRQVQVFPPHLIVAYRNCDQQSEVDNFLCRHTLIHKHMYTPLC